MYDVRVSCPQGGTSSPIQSLQSNSSESILLPPTHSLSTPLLSTTEPPVVVNVVTQAVFNDSGTFSTLQWEVGFSLGTHSHTQYSRKLEERFSLWTGVFVVSTKFTFGGDIAPNTEGSWCG